MGMGIVSENGGNRISHLTESATDIFFVETSTQGSRGAITAHVIKQITMGVRGMIGIAVDWANSAANTGTVTFTIRKNGAVLATKVTTTPGETGTLAVGGVTVAEGDLIQVYIQSNNTTTDLRYVNALKIYARQKPVIAASWTRVIDY